MQALLGWSFIKTLCVIVPSDSLVYMWVSPMILMLIFFYRWKRAFSNNQPVLLGRSVAIIRDLPASQRHYCPQCGRLVIQEDLPTHKGHSLVHNITDAQLDTPTTLLTPRDDRKSQAVRNVRQCVCVSVDRCCAAIFLF